MPPKKNNNKPGGKAGGPAPSPEQLRAMGMSEEQIQQLLALRGMSAEQQKEQSAAEDQKRQFDHRRKALEKTELTARDAVAREEFEARGQILHDRDRDYDEAHQKSEKRRAEEERAAKKAALERMRLHREELQRKQRQEREEALETWHALPEDVRAARIAELNAEVERKERELHEQFQREQERKEKEEAERQAKEKARREKMQKLREEREKWGAVASGGADGAHADDLAHEAGQAMLETKQSRNMN